MPSIPESEISKEKLKSFLTVGIGASAGGLQAVSQLLRQLPADTGMAFVLIQHLDPDHDSQLSEILAHTTQMPVNEVQDGMAIAPNCVYVIPPNTNMTLNQGILQLAPRQQIKGRYMAINAFLSSLALDRGSKAIAIVLSGSNEDGTLGLSAVKAVGGTTFAQDLQSSEYSVMPQSAIASGDVDFVLAPADIAAELVKISRSPMPIDNEDNHADEENDEPNDESQASAYLEEIAAFLPRILVILRSSMGVDFSQYKQGTIRRRLMKRVASHNLANLEDYVKYLQANPLEVEKLYRDILINVTSFFRDDGVFEALKTTVFPIICEDKSHDEPIRIWCAGCSTGEEAYSIAISLLEFLRDRPLKPAIQIFATDLSEVMIERARQGIYDRSLLTEVSSERLHQFFEPVEGGYQISKSVRDLCVFARQNLTSDPPFSRLDMISCRNVMIYMQPVLQKKLIPIFHYALKSHGFLMLGSAESVGKFSDLFTIADKKSRIYAHRPAPTRLNFSFATRNLPTAKLQYQLMNQESQWNDSNLEETADRLVLDRYAPAGVIINADLEILQFRGDTSPYLKPIPGKATLNLLKMVRSSLTIDLRTAIQRAKKENETIRREGLLMEDRQVDLVVIPFKLVAVDDRFFLILFVSGSSANLSLEAAPLVKSKRIRQTESDREILHLKQELATTKEYLQSVIAAEESSNQDFKVANEEILSSNEELQSTNEELETAKEEIQATNEELSTINDELRNRNLQLNQVNSDLQNFLSSVNIPILMLSNDLRIRRFTPMAEKLFNLIPSDIGRPFSDIHPNINTPNLVASIAKTIETLNTHEQEVQDENDRWYSLRIRPYKTLENQIDGAVISLFDIDALKRSAMLLESVVETSRSPLVMLDANFNVIKANRSFYQTFQLLPTQTEYQNLFILGQGYWNIPQLRSLLTDMITSQTCIQDFEFTQDFAALGSRTILLNAAQIPQVDDETSEQMILLAIEDITNRKNAEVQIRNSLQEKEVLLHEIRHRVKNNLQVISSLLSLQGSRVNNPEAIQIIQDSKNRVQSIALMYETLHQSPHLNQLNFAAYFQTLVAYLFRSCNLHPEVVYRVSVSADIEIDPDRALLVGLIVNELVTNALKHGFSDRFLASNIGEVSLEVSVDRDRNLILAVGNNSNSLPVDFDLDAISSMGLSLVKRLAAQLNGNLYFYQGNETIISVSFPLE
ncbi:MAG: histidine kinase [Pseudanabaena sp.]|nr:MAG: histidine kinase [Pseudanabaena sp.]